MPSSPVVVSNIHSAPAFVPLVTSMPLPLPEYIVRLARTRLDGEIVLILDDTGKPSDATISSLTWRHVLTHVHRRTEFILEATGRAPRKLGEEAVNVGLLARSDYSYFVTLMAMIMLRWTVLLISPRNSSEAVKSLMQSVGGVYLIVDTESNALATSVASDSFDTVHVPKVDLVADRLPSHSDLSDWDKFLGDAADVDLAKEARMPVVHLHTSGSTGHPKKIPWTHEFTVTLSHVMRKDRPEAENTTIYTPMPLYHATAHTLSIITLLGTGGVYTFVNTRHPISASLVLRHLSLFGPKLQDIDLVLAPSIIEDLIGGETKDQGLQALRTVHMVLFGGAPLKKDVGDSLVNNGVCLVAGYGMTETGLLARMSPGVDRDPLDWDYYCFLDDYKVKLDPVDEAGLLHTLLVMPGAITPCVLNQDDPIAFKTGDLWLHHPDPTKAHLWKYAGRADDITVLSNGEKTDNKQLDALLCSTPHIAHTAIFGSGRFMNGAILKPSAPLVPYTPKTVSAYLDAVWPHIIGHVNPILPQHSRLVRPLVLVAKPDKAMLLTDKGTVKVKLTLAMYEEEIQKAYQAMEDGEGLELAMPQSGFLPEDVNALRQFLHAAVANVLHRAVGDENDLFDAGLDSLLATRIRSSIVSAIRRSGRSTDVSRNVVYSYPTISSLVHFLQSALASDSEADRSEDIHTQIERTITEFTANLPYHQSLSTSLVIPGSGAVYAVTGTTGSLGSFYLSLLLRKPDVQKVYLLNRSSKSATVEQRQKDSFSEKGLDYQVVDQAIADGRAVYLEIDLSRKDLGLSQKAYEQLRSEVTHIVHNAWLLNFNLILPSFRTHVAGVRNIIDLSLSSPRPAPPHVTFISSVAAAGRYAGPGPVPEAPISSSSMCLEQGYAHSKYVAEKILEEAVKQRSDFRATIVRTGQLSGAEETGAWARSENMPILFQSCSQLGVVPKDLPPVRWLPVNVAADILDKLVSSSSSATFQGSKIQFYSLDNGLSAPWSLIADALVECRSENLRLVPMEQWLDQVKATPDTPAAKLLEFFEDLHGGDIIRGLDVARARQVAGNIVDHKIGMDLVRKYVSYATA